LTEFGETPDEQFEPSEDDEVSEVEYQDDQDAVNNSDDFRARFGFDHECHCADDWSVGNLGVVAVCYLNMCRDAMEHLASARQEISQKDDEIAALRIQLADK
jgi:hypothetical protein